MPRGAGSFEKSAERQKAKRSFSDSPRADYFKIEDGEMARMRFLEQGEDLTWAYCHRIKLGNASWPQDIICLDQEDEGAPCPLCQHDNTDIRRRSKKGFLNIIWRGNEDLAAENDQLKRKYKLAPIYKRNDKGIPEKDNQGNKIITGFGDSIWLWKCSKTVFEIVLSKDNAYKGIMSRDFAVMRTGAGLEDTKYFIEPAEVDGGPQPMLVADMSLMNNKYDLDALTRPESFVDLAQRIEGQSTQSSPRELPTAQDDIFGGAPPMRSSAFQR